jgi:mRNA interferase HigB
LRVISLKRIREFIEKHSDARISLLAWHTTMKAGNWQSFEELKRIFGSADLVGKRTVFNIAHNRYRLIARVNYKTRVAFVLHILTHKEYMKGNWKK